MSAGHQFPFRCRCKARRCDTCGACSKCLCYCNGPPSRRFVRREDSKKKNEPEISLSSAKKPRQLTIQEAMGGKPRGPAEKDIKPSVVAPVPPPEVPKEEPKKPEYAPPPIEPAAPEVETVPMTLEEHIKSITERRVEEQAELVALEKQIFELEGAYLRRNQYSGNIAKGWAPANVFVAQVMKDQLLEVELIGENPREMTRVEADAVNQQRIFSYSSITSPGEMLAQKWIEHRSDEELALLELAKKLESEPEGRTLRKRPSLTETPSTPPQQPASPVAPSPQAVKAEPRKPKSKRKKTK
ncbi:hypothetical protein THRCLA_21605 [Thraustotheca clavata]|uniref:Uncharacterized protein n=1 Tax=Thraustotheca clavata TaxID=74557 RepID=A0A1V9ZVI8_9STRA|nr:hypothetical protein THRCLA_21605 [Thraustotheca clavata]